MSEAAGRMDLEALLADALRPIDPPESLSSRVETTPSASPNTRADRGVTAWRGSARRRVRRMRSSMSRS